MKRFLGLLLAVCILLGSAPMAAAANMPERQKVYTDEPNASAAFLAGVAYSLLGWTPEEPEEEITLSQRAVYCGLPADIQWIEHPETNEDIENNILFSFLNGQYHFQFDNLTPEQGDWLFQQIRNVWYISQLACSYPELAGALANVSTGCGNWIRSDGYLFTDSKLLEKVGITDELLYQQQLEALDTALAISKQLHKDGTLHDGMSQMEIAWVYYDYLRDLGVRVGDGKDAVQTGKTALFDSAWACLVNKTADCVGRAAGFNLLMHIEGISAQGVRGSFRNTDSGHVLSRVILDGQEYFCDWGNDKGILEQAEFEKYRKFDFDLDSLTYAREHDGK